MCAVPCHRSSLSLSRSGARLLSRSRGTCSLSPYSRSAHIVPTPGPSCTQAFLLRSHHAVPSCCFYCGHPLYMAPATGVRQPGALWPNYRCSPREPRTLPLSVPLVGSRAADCWPCPACARTFDLPPAVYVPVHRYFCSGSFKCIQISEYLVFVV
jgi:hypothetical protein